jgi:ribose transport system substrate-binding protein
VISTDPGVSSVDARVEGFKTKAQELGLTLVGDTQYSHNQPATAAQVISATLAGNPDLAGVFATNLFTAQGVATGVKQAGKSGQVKVVGFDAGPDQIKQLEAGDVQALVAQKPYDIGEQGVKEALAAIDGGTVTKEIETESLIVTKENMNEPDVSKYIYKASC